MAETTEIEKKSLEAHVELCAERYRHLEEKLETVDHSIASLNNVAREMRDMLAKMNQKRYDQVMAWAGGLVATLVGIIGYLLSKYVV